MSADELYKKAEKSLTITITRWKPDIEGAAGLFEQAGNAYKGQGKKDRAFVCFEKLSECHEKLGNEYYAAKHLETAAQMAKDAGSCSADEIAALFRRSQLLYATANKPIVGADCLVRGGKLVETMDGGSDIAGQLYQEACEVYEEEEKFHLAVDVYRAAAIAAIRADKVDEAATLLLKNATACEKAKAVTSQCRCYLAAVVTYLHGKDPVQAEACYNDCLGIEDFEKSEESQACYELLDAYNQNDEEQIKRVCAKPVFTGLENAFNKVAKKLPRGDLAKQAAALNKSRGGGEGQRRETVVTATASRLRPPPLRSSARARATWEDTAAFGSARCVFVALCAECVCRYCVCWRGAGRRRRRWAEEHGVDEDDLT